MLTYYYDPKANKTFIYRLNDIPEAWNGKLDHHFVFKHYGEPMFELLDSPPISPFPPAQSPG